MTSILSLTGAQRLVSMPPSPPHTELICGVKVVVSGESSRSFGLFSGLGKGKGQRQARESIRLLAAHGDAARCVSSRALLVESGN